MLKHTAYSREELQYVGAVESRHGNIEPAQPANTLFCFLLIVLAALLVGYSETIAFIWDEGFHLLAAQLILHGKKPYLDFCFPQTPLNAFWNAAWMRILGDTWRSAHALAATTTMGAIVLAADFLRTRFPDKTWRVQAASAAALLLGLNAAIVEYGTIGQSYAFCLFLLMCAFRAAVVAVHRSDHRWTAAAGLFSGAAAASSLLTAMAAPVFLLWILWHTPLGKVRQFLAFVCGAACPFLPVVWLFVREPRVVFFNLFQYQLLYRRTNWEDATPHDFEVLTSWLYSPGVFLLGLLALLGLWFVARKSDWSAAGRAPFYLCGCLGLAIGIELCAAHPTFPSYWTLVTPFVAIPAAAGLYAVTVWLPAPIRRGWIWAALVLVLSVGLAKSLREDRNRLTWQDMEALSRKVDEVTAPGAPIWADEQVYFISRRTPAEGTEFSYAEVIDVPEDQARKLHILSDVDLDRKAAEGIFRTVSTCEDPDVIEKLELLKLFRRKADVGGRCKVFWDPVNHPGAR
ncbi:MAG TPA: hypothetical protein VKU19_04320 [Bryobacteraceae bacterium]|nr:hypothetical protein [Bryobacteraceae bacterium]